MKTKTLAALLALPLAVSTARAQEGEPPAVKVSGFGTGALTWTNTNDARFARPYQAGGAGTKPRTGVDSNVGLQVDARVNDWLSLTGQGIVRKLETDAYGATGTLAFAKAKVSDTLAVRVGRVPLAAFLVSDYRNVGYANTMLRPSQEVYAQVPNDSLDGADLDWRQEVGGSTLTTQVAYGRSTAKLAGETVTFTNARVVNFVLEHGPFTLRLGRDDARMVLKQGGIELPQLKVSFTAAGFAMDANDVVVQSEYTVARGFGAASKGWYVMGGYRFGKVLPFASHGRLTGDVAQRTDSVGVRWDAFRSADIKFQVDRVRPEGAGLFNQPRPGFRGPVTVGAVAVDFVF
ncbi:hypothetical protein NX786_14280 [Telluria mixta]|uniref:Porin domain-containing protein n=1 Tax=Telluria mixta TaxID=34071 RepID=A0ABT2BZD9_9BURK|nr:hypothetical protein [Telluria mixta]MCS0630503.1 hypothetical protein [Telluria mixta]WEM94192.1 hypothetical protein P0M04_22215 [Telluria mixta]